MAQGIQHRRLLWAAALLVSAGVSTGCRGALKSQPPVHLQQNMDNVHLIESQEPFDFFEDGRGMRPQVEGTVAVGELRNDEVYHEGTANGQYVSTLPEQLELSDELLARGEERYGIYCTPCHGAAGDGQGIVGYRDSAFGGLIPTFHDELRRGYPVGRIYNIVTNGSNNMLPYAAQIPTDDRWAIAAWVRVLQVGQGATQAQHNAGAAADGAEN